MKFILFIGIAYGLLSFFVYWYQESLIFFPDVLAPDYEFTHFKNVEEMYFQPDEATRLHALRFTVDNPKGVILYFHGNARALDSWGYVAEEYTRRGYEIVMPDYRGFGKSTGLRSEEGITNDAKYIYNQLIAKHGEANIVLYGRSLGSGIACAVAATSNPRLLILETPYYSLLRMASEQMRYLPTRWLLRFHFRTDKNLKNVTCPVYLFHGTEDELIPYQHALDLKDHVPTTVLTTVPGASHNNLSDFDLFNEKIDEILRNGD